MKIINGIEWWRNELYQTAIHYGNRWEVLK